MSDYDSKFLEYKQDSRMPCQYGAKCYQKNSAHHTKYKHPPQKGSRKTAADKRSHINKKRKLSDHKVEEKIEETFSDSSDSESEISKTSDTKIEEISPSESSSSDEVISDTEDASTTATKGSESPDKTTGDKNDSDDIISDSFSESESPQKSPAKASDQDTKTEPETVPVNSTLDHKNPKAEPETVNSAFDHKKFLKNRFLVDMPQDFYQFWDMCKKLKPGNPSDAFKEVGLTLVGPFDVMSGKFKHIKKTPQEFLCHWRYYYDPPEVQTVLKGDDKTGFHIGYFRDSPEEVPVFLVGNHGVKDGEFIKMGDNIFAAVNIYLEDLKKTGDPFKKMHVGKFLTTIKKYADNLKLNLSSHSENIRKRNYKIVTNTSNKIGLVVPYDKKTQMGYRDLAMTDKEIKTLLDRLQKAPEQKTKILSNLQPVLTYANIALDECDFGTGIKLGWDLMCHGIDSLDSTILHFLANSYNLLNRQAFAQIAEAHLSTRKKGCHLSII